MPLNKENKPKIKNDPNRVANKRKQTQKQQHKNKQTKGNSVRKCLYLQGYAQFIIWFALSNFVS